MTGSVFAIADLPAALQQELAERPSAGVDEAYAQLLHVLQAVPAAVERLRSFQIEEEIIRDTFSDISIWATCHKKKTGRWGLSAASYGWLQNHLQGKLFRIGRLQCCPGLLDDSWNLRVFCSVISGRLLALAERETCFRKDGQVSGTNGIMALDDGFTGYSQDGSVKGERYFEGTPYSPYGHAVNCPIRLSASGWTEMLRSGMPVLNLHIPEGEGFTLDACRQSLLDMRRFVYRHKEGIRKLCGIDVAIAGEFSAFCIGSWLLDAQLEQLLPAETAIVQFLKSFYLVPTLADEKPTLERVFGVQELNLKKVPQAQRATSLQRNILAFMKSGGSMRYNLGFLRLKDAQNFGKKSYRNEFDELLFNGEEELLQCLGSTNEHHRSAWNI